VCHRIFGQIESAQGMADMFMATPPSFDSILQVLGGLEERINAAASAV
jgi:hypothetical protein